MAWKCLWSCFTFSLSLVRSFGFISLTHSQPTRRTMCISSKESYLIISLVSVYGTDEWCHRIFISPYSATYINGAVLLFHSHVWGTWDTKSQSQPHHTRPGTVWQLVFRSSSLIQTTAEQREKKRKKKWIHYRDEQQMSKRETQMIAFN